MNEKEKKAIEYLKTRLHGNEGCKYIDVSQEDLRIFINLVDRKEKDIEGWKKYCEEIEEEQTEMSNKNCELEFEVEKLQKENEELKNNGPIDENEFELVVDCDYDRLKRLIDTTDKSEEFILYNNEKWIKEKYSVSIEKIKEKIEELNIEISTCEYADDDSEEYKQEVEKNKAELLMAKKVLQRLLESEENK